MWVVELRRLVGPLFKRKRVNHRTPIRTRDRRREGVYVGGRVGLYCSLGVD